MRQSILFVALSASVAAVPSSSYDNHPVVSSTTCNGKSFTYNGLAGYGYIPYSSRDSRKDTIGGIGSSIAIDKKSWRKTGKNQYSAVLYGLPDRGFNVNGTLNFDSRIQKFKLTFDASKTSGTPNTGNIKFEYLETIFLYDPKGVPMTGLDADIKPGNRATFAGFPDLPVVHYTGDGYGNAGPGGERVPLDSEGLALTSDGGFWVSDEYGPYVYRFNSKGKLVEAIRPPNAFIPLRNGSQSFSADSPPNYNPSAHPLPVDPTSGRQNNQGLEGLTINPKGDKLYTLIQSALRQDGGTGGSGNRYYARFLAYDISKAPAKLTAEFVVRLPQDSTNRTAAQSEIHYISETEFLVLARDSSRGAGQSNSTSLYRQADIFSIAKATNIIGKYDNFSESIVTNVTTAALKSGITTAEYCKFVNFNNNTELGKFGLRNGGNLTAPGLLNEKWEGLAVLPVEPHHHEKRGDHGHGHDHGKSDEYFLFAMSDNDFRAMDVYVNNGKQVLHDTVNLENQFLAFRITLPKGSKPLIG